MPDRDILICGGGLVGATLALALSKLEFNVALVEAVPFDQPEQPSFDERTTAISNGTQRIFEALGVWPLIARLATPIKRIHVSDKGRFGFARVDAREQELPQLGFVVVNRVMGDALWRRLQESRIDVFAPARVVSLNVAAERVTVGLSRGSEPDTVTSRLVIAADGANSAVREMAGIGTTRREYEQTAIIANIACQKFHEHVAYERFTPEGPLAMLPLGDARVGLVWVLAKDKAVETLQLGDAEFISRLQNAFGMRLGRFTQIGKRSGYPLALTQADAHVAARVAIIGNAAQGLHPIAGQGFNLGLRDAACLAEVLADARRDGRVDAGSQAVLQRYADWRGQDRAGIVRFTDGLVRLFAQDLPPIKMARDLGMLLFDLSPVAKDYLARLSLGAAGKIPRLARGGHL